MNLIVEITEDLCMQESEFDSVRLAEYPGALYSGRYVVVMYEEIAPLRKALKKIAKQNGWDY